ncbi:polysaccharide biosynthesis protein [Chryseobacterium koreense]|uniref:Capsule biosynthesis protein CapD n=1 Tax=Chryseobacterium koreense CCUG 49689 TaxID=1304281 RepID=A0A0J7IY08_9FLAO|nr:nucleoside-diphosphate sugar epimerase/dehydratase [Chryseobacterium koreense]KMQ71123.1 capsule biosynthesis protein CapD [Chryseobacterium koreense CCUG 49689]MBB5332755.1 FlaA1/EpsC-like NDP-sugar epimerase [Chryseobacterium koreense]
MSLRRSIRKKMYGGDNFMNISDIRYLPRWVILLIDILFVCAAITFGKYLIEKLSFGTEKIFYDDTQMYLIIASVSVFFMFVFKTYAGIIRHSTFIDLFKLFLSTFCTTVVLGAVSFSYYLLTGKRMIYMSIPFLAIFFATSFMMLFLFRLFVKEFFQIVREFRRSTLRKRILVLGIDEQSVAVARAIVENPTLPYHVVGFLTQRHDSRRANLLGKPIYSKEKIENNTKEDLIIDGVLLVKEIMTKEEMNSWVNLFLEKDLQVFKAPLLQKVRSADMGGSIQNLQIEDLLNRKPIRIENEEVRKRHYGKNILITGGAGSIGSEIMRQVAQFSPTLIVVVDQAETPLYEVELEMRNKFPGIPFKFILGDISNKHAIEPIFKKYEFSMVYHAAAYKHVPLIEENPREAVLVNILGTKILATLSSKYGVNRFVMISTDKAVNPTNVMGASKRVAELFVQALQNTEGNTTKFITTRFGNVLGSNGSVIPHFKKQIEAGGPITITHPDIVRYFMTIPEACDLVLQAGTMGNGGEIFVFDMGEPVKIQDLATRMIKLSGLEPHSDIKIIYTGLRPGEKLYEELLSDDAKTMPTPNEKIMVSKDPIMDFEEIDHYTRGITRASLRREKIEVVQLLKNIVPEFKSNNSIYEVLD